jgi:hypothetical protein
MVGTMRSGLFEIFVVILTLLAEDVISLFSRVINGDMIDAVSEGDVILFVLGENNYY